MAASASMPLAERTRLHLSQAFQNRAANVANAQGALFEQLLSLSFTVQPPPATEPESDLADSSVVADSTSTTDSKHVATTDEEQDDVANPPVALLTPAIPLIAEQPVEPIRDQSAVDKHANTEALKAVEVAAIGDAEPIAIAATDTGVSDQVSVQADAQVEVTGNRAPFSTVAATKVEELNSDDDSRALGRQKDRASNKNGVSTTKLETPHNEPLPGLDANDVRDSRVSAVAQSTSETENRPEVTSLQKDETGDRRGDQREKWFERKNEPLRASAPEHPLDSGSNSPRENLDPAAVVPKDSAVQQASQDASTSVVDPLFSPTTPIPVAPPIALAAASQGITATVTPASTTTPAANSESTDVVNPGPARAVGSQATKAKPNGKATEPGLSQQERVRVIQRIARSFNRISTEGGTINLRLHPQHLGSVSVQVRLEGRSLSARLSTETAAARDAIMQDLPALRQRLADQGFDVTKFQVDVSGNGADASFAQSNGQPQSGQSENRSSGSQTDYRRFAANRESRSATTRQLLPAANPTWQTSSGIDLQA